MKRFNFVLREEPDFAGNKQYSIEIAALDHSGSFSKKGVVMVVKQYEDEASYRQDVLVDFTSAFSGGLKPNGVVYLSDERARYYGWGVHKIENAA
jgi:hypothetical protein